MNYKLPIYTDEELEAANSYPPLENGRYKFRVLERKQGFSKANNPQEQLVLEVQHKPNHTMKCYHNFTFNNPRDKGHLWLVGMAKSFLECIGVEYNADAFDRVVNREGVADFFAEEYTSKKDGKTKERFIVPNEGFISPDDLNKPAISTTQVGAAATPAGKPTTSFDDDIPF